MPTEEEEDDEDTDGLFSVDSMREELERLRKDEPTDQLTADAPSDGQAKLPSVVPQIPTEIRVSDSMKTLVDVVCKTSSPKVGFYGIGERFLSSITLTCRFVA